MDVYNYDIKRFLTEHLPVDYPMYMHLLKNLTASDSLLNKTMPTLEQQPFKNIITIENLFKKLSARPENKIDIVAVCFSLDTYQIEQVGIIEFYKAFNYVHSKYSLLIERENLILGYEADSDELEAGIDKMIKFGRIATVDTLSGGNILQHTQIIELPYKRIFTKLQLDKTKAEIQKSLQKIKSKKE
jgi:hypothetical protein